MRASSSSSTGGAASLRKLQETDSSRSRKPTEKLSGPVARAASNHSGGSSPSNSAGGPGKSAARKLVTRPSVSHISMPGAGATVGEPTGAPETLRIGVPPEVKSTSAAPLTTMETLWTMRISPCADEARPAGLAGPA